jgi:hypothetical protein
MWKEHKNEVLDIPKDLRSEEDDLLLSNFTYDKHQPLCPRFSTTKCLCKNQQLYKSGRTEPNESLEMGSLGNESPLQNKIVQGSIGEGSLLTRSVSISN